MMRTLATLILTVTPVFAAPGPQGAPASPPAELAARIARVAPSELTATDLAVILLDASLEEVTRWLAGLDEEHGGPRHAQHRGAGAETVRRRAEEVPAVLRGLLSQGTMPSEAHAHALALGIEITRSKRSPGGFRALTDLVASATGVAPNRAGVAPEYLKRAVVEATSLRLFRFPDLERLYRQAPAPLLQPILDGVAAGPDPDFSAGALARLLGSAPATDPSVLNRIHLALQRRPTGPAPEIADRVAAYLDDPRPFARHEAAACLARIGERAHVPPLIERLGDAEATVANAAHTALHRLTGMTLPPDPGRWAHWFEGQLAWWDSEGQSQLDELVFATRSVQLAILRDICTKRLFHEEIAVRVGDLLHGGDDSTLCLALSALGTLRSPSALALVRSYVGHPQPAVQEAALAALRSYQQAQGFLQPHSAGRPR